MTTKNGALLLSLFLVVVSVYTQSVLVMARGPRFAHNWNAHKRFRGGRVKRPEYYGSGCPPSSLMLVNSSDDTSFAMSVMFAAFQAQTSVTTLRDKKKCFVNVEPGMSVGIVHIDFRGYAYVPEANPESFAQLSASYKMGRGVRGMIAERNFSSGYMDDLYEGMDFDPIVWTPCKNNTSQRGPSLESSSKDSTCWIRIESKIVAQKARFEDEDVQIGIDSSDATLVKRQLQYQMTSRPCE